MNNVVKYGVGLLALGVTVYVVGVAWKRSQKKNGAMAGFTNAGGNSRLAAISQAARGEGKPQYLCLCKCGKRVQIPSGQTAAACPGLCADACAPR